MYNDPGQQRELARPYRKSLLIALLLITFSSGLLFAWINLDRGNLVVASAELFMAAYSVVLYFNIRRTQRLELWAFAYLIPFFSVMMVALASPRSTMNVFVWVLLIPMVSHLLLGRIKGLILTVIYMSIAAGLFFWRFGDDPEAMQPVILANIGVLTLCLTAFSHVYEITREQSERRLVKLAHSDVLTGLPNRAHLQSRFEYEQARHQRLNNPMSLVLLDLDYFKKVNDRHGHEAGDKALQHVARLLKQRLRKTDLAARLGGEEFCLLLPDTDGDQALLVAEKIRQQLAASPLTFGEHSITLTLSGGIACFGEQEGMELNALTRCADKKLYSAKSAGRNRIALAL